MTSARIVLAVAVLSTGLFTGLVLYIVGLFQPLLSELTAAEFTVVMGRFLPAARKNWLNYLFTLTSLLAPVVALILLRDHTGSAMFWLTLAGLGGLHCRPDPRLPVRGRAAVRRDAGLGRPRPTR